MQYASIRKNYFELYGNYETNKNTREFERVQRAWILITMPVVSSPLKKLRKVPEGLPKNKSKHESE